MRYTTQFAISAYTYEESERRNIVDKMLQYSQVEAMRKMSELIMQHHTFIEREGNELLQTKRYTLSLEIFSEEAWLLFKNNLLSTLSGKLDKGPLNDIIKQIMNLEYSHKPNAQP